MPGTIDIHEFLREAHVPYTVMPHRPAFTAKDEAAATRVPGADWAKVDARAHNPAGAGAGAAPAARDL